MFNNVPDSVRNRAQGVQISGKIELPFDHVTLRWHNGNPQAGGNLAKTGGWKANAPEFVADLMSLSLDVPPAFSKETLWTREGKSYEVFGTPYICAALIGLRDAWFVRENGSRQYGFQALVLTAERNKAEKRYDILFPAVLKANGWAGTRIKDALLKWQTITKAPRVKFANGLPAWFFYGMFGTVFKSGGQPKFESVGTGGNQSPITPCQVYEPESLTREVLETIYLGDTGIALWGDMVENAQEWLSAWDRYKNQGQASTQEPNQNQGFGGYPGMDDQEDEDIPF